MRINQAVLYSRAHLIRMANARKNHANYPSMRIIRAILHYVLMNSRELCLEQACELSEVCELARVKLSGLYCIIMVLNGHLSLYIPANKYFLSGPYNSALFHRNQQMEDLSARLLNSCANRRSSSAFSFVCNWNFTERIALLMYSQRNDSISDYFEK